jgi:phage N-6-adenine-methyltransferase
MSSAAVPPIAKPDANRDNWSTPEDFRVWYTDVFGYPECDAAASLENKFGNYYIAEPGAPTDSDWLTGLDGLQTPWSRHTFCNPPGSLVAPFTARALQQVQERGISARLLVQCGLESKWYDAVREYCETLILTPRIQFNPPPGVAKSSNARNYMLLVFDPWMVHVPAQRMRVVKWK